MVLVEILTRIGLTVCRRCGHGAKIVETIIELHGICHHGCSWLGRGNVVGALVGSRMRAKAPAARSSRKLHSIVAKRNCKGGGVVGWVLGWLHGRGALASGTWYYGFK